MRSQEQIVDILHQRKLLFTEIERMQVSLLQHWQSLHALEQLDLQIIHDNEDPLSYINHKRFDFSVLKEKIEAEIKELEQPKARFSRNTLNIGVIGRSQQGKSRLLQSLSGLDASVIPPGRYGRSGTMSRLIRHEPHQRPHGEIIFYTEQEFLDHILAPYYHDLSLGAAPASLQDFASTALPALSTHGVDSAIKQIAYQQLVSYHLNIDKYQSMLGAPLRYVGLQEVPEYTAQIAVESREHCFKYMAVKEVRILTHFPSAASAPISIIDLPCLEDQGIRIPERLTRILNTQIDMVLFVHMPSSTVPTLSYSDVCLYNLVQQALKSLSMEQCASMVLNQVNTPLTRNNYLSCNHLYYLMTSNNAYVYDTDVRFGNVVIADCSNPEEVQQFIMSDALGQLAEGINELDRNYLAIWQQRLAHLQQEVTEELDREICF